MSLILIFFYTLLFTLALPIILLRLIWQGLRSPAYFKRLHERFGYVPVLNFDKSVIWIHAVSVGEVEASRPLIKLLQNEFPKYQLIMTTMTPTGSERVKLLFSDVVRHSYLPYDVPFAIKRFIAAIHPQFGVIMETEIWPNLISICTKNDIKIILANARISERSIKGYQCISTLTHRTLQSLTLIAAQSEQDRQYFLQLGADSKKVHTIGNLKYEIDWPSSIMKISKQVVSAMWDISRPVLIAASTHEGEEKIILNALFLIRIKYPDLLLIIAPRNPERFDRVAALSKRMGFKMLRRSEHQYCMNDINVLVVDSMGELPLFYATSDIAFVGGSLFPHGGHNLLEPAALGRAIITGPYYFNFNEITRQFIQAEAAVEVIDIHGLATTVIDLLHNPSNRAAMGRTSLRLIVNSQGAGIRLINLIKLHVL